MTGEWMTVLDKVIRGKNDGTVREKVRGNVKNGLLVDMQLARKKTVELVHSEGIRVRGKFAAIFVVQMGRETPRNP